MHLYFFFPLTAFYFLLFFPLTPVFLNTSHCLLTIYFSVKYDMEIKDKYKILEGAKEKLERLAGYLDLEEKKQRLKEIDNELKDPGIWNNRKKSVSLSKEKSRLESDIKIYDDLKKLYSEMEVFIELDEEGENVEEDFKKANNKFKKDYKEAELFAVFKSPEDKNPAFLTINPGAGGTESQDWAEMLLRMYLRWAELKNYKSEIIEIQAGEEAGIKNATIRIDGDYAFGFLKTENGVHRLIRISPFDANKRRHTSFVAIFVYPEVDESIDVEVNPNDLRIDTFKASGHGGQHVNTTDSAVRITHVPTGIVATCQSERSQHKNKRTAMKFLKSKIYEEELKKRKKKQDQIEKNKSDISWGNQIRTYTLHPFKLIKDHRTNVEVGDTKKVLDGELDEFIYAALMAGIGQ